MLTSLTHFTVYLALSSSILDPRDNEVTGALWKNNVHNKVYSSKASAVVPTTKALRRSGELRKEGEHEEVTLAGHAPSRRYGELWRGLGHEEISTPPVV
ncbi:hypothetical protein BDR07DRAFT_1613246 [Suillus spraguei]|nr:hypothetical protein BDR07DRAFT_1613246 [Suillus spraguei]